MLTNIGDRGIRIVENLKVCGRHIGLSQDLLTEDLTAFQFRSPAIRSKNGQAGSREQVHDPIHQWRFRPDDGQTDLFNPNTSRASLGAVFTHPLGEASGQETDRWLQEHGVKVFAARVDAEQLYTDQDFTGPVAIVLGNEASGLTPLWHATHVTPIRLPMLGTADSLNVSAAAAVLLYEARRQRSAERNI